VNQQFETKYCNRLFFTIFTALVWRTRTLDRSIGF